MPDLFGTPVGDIAYHKNVLTQMQSLGIASDIRAQNVLADTREAKLDAAERLQELQAQYRAASPEERDQVGAAIRASTGQNPTQADLQQLAAGPQDPLDQMDAEALWLYGQGEVATAQKMLESSTLSRQRRSQAYQNKAQGALSQAKTKKATLQANADQAFAIGSNPGSWDRYVMNRRGDPQNPKWILKDALPQEMLELPYEQVQPLLMDIRRRGLGELATIKQAEEQLNNDAKRKASKASEAASRASAASSKMLLKQRELDYDLAVKYDGDKSEAAAELQEKKLNQADITARAETLITAPLFPLRPLDAPEEGGATIGLMYTVKDDVGAIGKVGEMVQVILRGYTVDDEPVFEAAPGAVE